VSTLILGVGNPLLGDDGVGAFVAERVREAAGSSPGLEVRTASAGGQRLVEEMLGYDHVIMVDAIAMQHGVGRIHNIDLRDLTTTVHHTNPHGLSFAAAYQMVARLSPECIPRKIQIYAIEIDRRVGFSQELSPSVKRAAKLVTERILRSLDQKE